MKKTSSAKHPTKIMVKKRARQPSKAMPEAVPDNIIHQYLEAAQKSGEWMIAVWRIEDNKILLDRTAVNFPKADIDGAMQLIVQDVQSLKTS